MVDMIQPAQGRVIKPASISIGSMQYRSLGNERFVPYVTDSLDVSNVVATSFCA